jgi:hypothetical protein
MLPIRSPEYKSILPLFAIFIAITVALSPLFLLAGLLWLHKEKRLYDRETLAKMGILYEGQLGLHQCILQHSTECGLGCRLR